MSWKEINPLALWENSTTIPKSTTTESPAENIGGKQIRPLSARIGLWPDLAELSPGLRRVYLYRLFKVWPYWQEQLAFNIPPLLLTANACVSNAYISTKINADILLAEPRLSFWEAFKRPRTRYVHQSSVIPCIKRRVMVLSGFQFILHSRSADVFSLLFSTTPL